MAKKKNKKVAEREPIQIPPQLLALQRPFFIGLTAIACISGLVIFYQAWQAWTSARAGEALVELRQTISEQIVHDIDERKKRLATVVNDAYLRADVAAGAMESAGERVKRVWFDAPAISVYSAQLEEVYKQDLREFGYTRLELINRAREAQDPVAAPIGSGARGNLGVAAAVREAGKAVGVVLVESTLKNYLRHIEQADLPRGYLALSNDSAMLAEAGDSQFAERAQRQAVADSGMYLSVAAPPTYSWVPYAPPVQFLMGFTMLLMGGYLGWGLRKAQSFTTTKIRPEEPTFLETLAAQPQADTTKKPVMDKPTVKPKVLIDRSIFRAYDIRGVVGVGIDEGVAQLIGQAVGSLMADKGLQDIVVGRDGRLSGPSLVAALIEGLRKAGRNVIDIGLAPTPVTYFAAYHLRTGSCVALTGSHNPPDYNGFKIVVGGETLSGDAITDLYARIATTGCLVAKGGGGLQQRDVSADYIQRIADDVQLERPLKHRGGLPATAWRATSRRKAARALSAARSNPLYCEIDGNFPNHHPDPSDPENLHDLIVMVQAHRTPISDSPSMAMATDWAWSPSPVK
jgi:phosphomannomutase/phosphoglucomutase